MSEQNELLVDIKDVQEGGENGNYLPLYNKPKINGITLEGDKTAEELGLSPDEEQFFPPEARKQIQENTQDINALKSGKVDKVAGKSLSTNDYTDTDKILVQDTAQEINALKSGKVDKVAGKSLSTNDYTDADKALVRDVTQNIDALKSGKVDKVAGKSLSTNDYTETDKTLVQDTAQEITVLKSGKVDKAAGKSLSTNDYTDADKALIQVAAQEIDTLKSSKVDKETGKSLSTNDYTDTDKTLVQATAQEITALKSGKVDKEAGKVLSEQSFTAAHQVQISTNTADIGLIQEDIAKREHFRGYFATHAEISALAHSIAGDYAYCAQAVPPQATGNKWIYTGPENGWEDSGEPVPDQTVPPGDANPKMNGTAAPGLSNEYSRSDHVHPADVSKAGRSEVYTRQETEERFLPRDEVSEAGGVASVNNKQPDEAGNVQLTASDVGALATGASVPMADKAKDLLYTGTAQTTASTGQYTVTVDSSFQLTDGVLLIIKMPENSKVNSFFNVNSKGGRYIVTRKGNFLAADEIANGCYAFIRYSATIDKYVLL